MTHSRLSQTSRGSRLKAQHTTTRQVSCTRYLTSQSCTGCKCFPDYLDAVQLRYTCLQAALSATLRKTDTRAKKCTQVLWGLDIINKYIIFFISVHCIIKKILTRLDQMGGGCPILWIYMCPKN